MKDLLKKFFETIDGAIAKITRMSPSLTPAEAQQLMDDINGLQTGLEDAFKKLQAVKPGLQRVINGDNLHDGHVAVEMSKAWAQLDAVQNGTDDYSQMIRNSQAEVQEDRARMAAEAAEYKRRQAEKFDRIYRQTHPH